MLHKPIDKLSAEDLRSLLKNQVREDRRLDYKKHLPDLRSAEEKKELLSNVIAMTAAGGEIVFGIDERREGGQPTGEPGDLIGVTVENRDAFTLQLENLLRDGVAPRLPSPNLGFIDLPEDKSVFILRMPRSWTTPHMLTFKTRSPFFARNNGGKYAMDVNQIRGAFLRSSAAEEKLRQFREERLAKIAAGDTPVPTVSEPRLVVHTLPLIATQTTQNVDPRDLERHRDSMYKSLLGSNFLSDRYNFDGYSN